MADALLKKGLSSPECIKPILTALFNALMQPIGSDSPKEIMELVHKYYWPSILQDDEVSAVQDQETRIYYDYSIFILLHAWACRLLSLDRNSDLAKTFIREKLGSCHKLLRSCFRRIIHDANQMRREIENLGIVVQHFMNCLVPVPIDRETNSFVRRARLVLEQALLRNKDSDDPFLMENASRGTYNFKGHYLKTLIHNMGLWQHAHYLTDEKLWRLFVSSYLVNANTVEADRRMVKDARKSCKKRVKQAADLKAGEMCENCFVLEKDLLEEQDEHDEKKYDEGDGDGDNGNGGLMKVLEMSTDKVL